MIKKIHKIKKSYCSRCKSQFTPCGLFAIDDSSYDGGCKAMKKGNIPHRMTTTDWKKVNCKNCLKHRK